MTHLHVPVPLRWNDLDAYGHVNNAAMLVLLEQSRVIAFWATEPPGAEGVDGGAEADADRVATAVVDASPGTDTLTLVAHQEIQYLAPVPYLRDPLDVEMWIGKLGGASLSVCYLVCSPVGAAERTIYARAQTTVVLVDATTQRPRRMTEVERAAWTPYLDEPIAFGRR